MGGNRKRHRPKKHDDTPNKRVCNDSNRIASSDLSHPTLSLYYPRILTLRGYVLSKLPATSKTRRRKIANIRHLDGIKRDSVKANHELRIQSSQSGGLDVEADLAKLLDRTLIVDFAIWLLFHRIHRQAYKPRHMLCHGYQRRAAPMFSDNPEGLSVIPGVALHYPNSHVATLKSRSWSVLLNLLGKDGEQIMLDLLLECAIYAGVENGKGNFYQLSGRIMSVAKSTREINTV
ncbi:MAG: hypothetical protein Q9223_002113 [Gallowayella weberi]